MPRLERHDDFFERGVARALAEAVDGTFDLARAACDGGKGVGRGHTKVVVAVGCEDNIIRTWHGFDQPFDQISAFHGGGVTNRVWNVDGCCARFDGDFDHAAEVIPLCASRIHRGPLHIVCEVAGMGDCVVDALGHFVHRKIGNGAVQL